MDRENYYILLDLNPKEEDSIVITSAIKKKQAEWTKLRNHPTKGNWANQQLRLLKDIRAIMGDIIMRKKESDAAEKIIVDRQQKLYQELDIAIAIFSSKGFIWEIEIKDLQAKSRFKNFSINDIKKRVIVEIKTKIKNDKKSEIKPIDKTLAFRIAVNLKIIGKTDLYDFLEVAKSSSLSTINKQIEIIDKANKKKASKTAEVTAIGELIGHCKSIFKTEKNQKKYNRTLALERFKELDPLLDIAGMDGIVRPSEFAEILKQTRHLALKKQEISNYIEEYCNHKGWIFQPAEIVLDNLIDCSSCGIINSKKARNCVNCGFPLVVDCPNCKFKNSSNDKSCTDCGYSIGDMPNALPLIKQGERLIIANEFAKAKAVFDLANNYWKNHPEIISGLKKINSLNNKFLKYEKEIEDLVLKDNYYSAQKKLVELQRINNNSLHHNQNLIRDKIKEAERFLQEAQFSKRPKEKELNLVKALLTSKDCEKAKMLLASLPPEPPSSLNYNSNKDIIELKWSKVDSLLPMQYKVIRKIGTTPKNENDGDLLIETSSFNYSDRTGIIGESYYYAVFSSRLNISSKKLTSIGPILKTETIKRLKAHPNNRAIHLGWEAPPKVTRIEVWVLPNQIPSSRNEGKLLPNVNIDGIIHSGLTNDQQYGYLVLPVFINKNGEEIFGNGQGVIAQPVILPTPIKFLRIDRKDKELSISWSTPKGSMALFESDTELPFTYKNIVTNEELSRVASEIQLQSKTSTSIRLNSSKEKIYLYPVTTEKDISIIGKIAIVDPALPEVNNLQGRIDRNQIILDWDFPKNIDSVMIGYSNGMTFPYGMSKELSLKEFNQKGKKHIEIFPSNWNQASILIRSIVQKTGSISYSYGTQLQLKPQRPIVQFTIKKNSTWRALLAGNQYELEIKRDREMKIPLILFAKENAKMDSHRDKKRIRILDIHQNDFEEKEIKIPFDFEPEEKTKEIFFTIYPKKDAHMNKVEIKDNHKKMNT